MKRAILVVVALAACAKEKQEHGAPAPNPPRAQLDATPAVVMAAADAAPAAAVACTSGGGLLGAVSRAQNAMDASRAIDQAEAALQAEACHDGTWFHAAAALARAGGQPAGIAGTKDALDQGLAADPDELGLLGYVAYLSGVDPARSPALPADACDRAKALPAVTGNAADVREHDELVDYVCAHVHLAGQAWNDALTELRAITDPPYPDVGVRIVEASRGAGDAKAAKSAVKAARAQLEKYRARLGVADGDIETLDAQL